jgi:DNA-binding NarL/FixJ family response regulator
VTTRRILIVDDHPLYRDGLKARLEKMEGCVFAGEAGTCKDGLLQARKLMPDLAMIDISLPDGSGIDLTRDILAILPQVRVIIISMHSKVEFISAAFQAGAAGYLAKDSAADCIVQAVEAVAAGKQYLESTLSPKIVNKLNEVSSRKAKCIDESYGTLSLREQQVMRLLAEGLTIQDIAEKLFVSRKTVGNYRYSIMSKLGVRSPLALVRHAARLGLVDISSDGV